MYFAIVELIKIDLDIQPGTPFKDYKEKLNEHLDMVLRIFET